MPSTVKKAHIHCRFTDVAATNQFDRFSAQIPDQGERDIQRLQSDRMILRREKTSLSYQHSQTASEKHKLLHTSSTTD